MQRCRTDSIPQWSDVLGHTSASVPICYLRQQTRIWQFVANLFRLRSLRCSLSSVQHHLLSESGFAVGDTNCIFDTHRHLRQDNEKLHENDTATDVSRMPVERLVACRMCGAGCLTPPHPTFNIARWGLYRASRRQTLGWAGGGAGCRATGTHPLGYLLARHSAICSSVLQDRSLTTNPVQQHECAHEFKDPAGSMQGSSSGLQLLIRDSPTLFLLVPASRCP